MIGEFKGSYAFLSNFSDSKITIDGLTFLNAEAAYQSYKDLSRQKEFTRLDPKTAKRKGKTVNLRPDWEDVKDEIMYNVVMAKFNQNEDLKKKLLATGRNFLQEGNYWNDTYWGVCNGQGRNRLGIILMSVRVSLAYLDSGKL